MAYIKHKKEVDDIFDELLEHMSEIHDEWDVDRIRVIKEQYDRVYSAWRKHEEKFNG